MIYNTYVLYGIHYTLLSMNHFFVLQAANNRLTSPLFFFLIKLGSLLSKEEFSSEVLMLPRNNPRLISIEVYHKLYKLSRIDTNYYLFPVFESNTLRKKLFFKIYGNGDSYSF